MYRCDLRLINQTQRTHAHTYVVKVQGQRGRGDYYCRNSQSAANCDALSEFGLKHTHLFYICEDK